VKIFIFDSLDRLQEAANRVQRQRTIRKQEDKLAQIMARFFKEQKALVTPALVQHWALAESVHLTTINDMYLIEDSTLDRVFDLSTADINDRYAEITQRQIEITYQLGINNTTELLNLALSFELDSPLAQAYLDKRGVDLLKELNTTTKARIKAIVSNGVRDGLSYDKIARDIKAEFNDYAKLPARGPKQIKSRAQLIAVTEVGNAYQAAGLATVRNAMDTGLKFEKKWSNTGDSRVSQGCLDNTAQGWLDIDDTFQSGDDRPLRFPGCRCALLMRKKLS
jgi:hypothetical protein